MEDTQILIRNGIDEHPLELPSTDAHGIGRGRCGERERERERRGGRPGYVSSVFPLSTVPPEDTRKNTPMFAPVFSHSRVIGECYLQWNLRVPTVRRNSNVNSGVTIRFPGVSMGVPIDVFLGNDTERTAT